VQKRSLWRYTVVEVRELRLSINRVLRARAFAVPRDLHHCALHTPGLLSRSLNVASCTLASRARD